MNSLFFGSSSARYSPRLSFLLSTTLGKGATMRESDIMHEVGNYWVARESRAYVVYKIGVTHSTSDSAYARTPDGLSIAIARANYLAKALDTSRR